MAIRQRIAELDAEIRRQTEWLERYRAYTQQQLVADELHELLCVLCRPHQPSSHCTVHQGTWEQPSASARLFLEVAEVIVQHFPADASLSSNDLLDLMQRARAGTGFASREGK